MSDIGLLRARSKVSAKTITEETEAYIKYKGAFSENYVVNELISAGWEPFFWRSGNEAEVDFIFEDSGEMIPVEVKAADNTQAKSYKMFCRKYGPRSGFKLSLKNIGVNNVEKTSTVSLPLYLVWNMARYINKER